MAKDDKPMFSPRVLLEEKYGKVEKNKKAKTARKRDQKKGKYQVKYGPDGTKYMVLKDY